jgi:hypothetical protein
MKTRDQYMILYWSNGILRSLDYNWIWPRWLDSERNEWRGGPVDEYGRRVMLWHFGLTGFALAPSLDEIVTLSWTALLGIRREREKLQNRAPWVPFNYTELDPLAPMDETDDWRAPIKLQKDLAIAA